MSKIAWNDEEGGTWNESEIIEWQWNDIRMTWMLKEWTGIMGWDLNDSILLEWVWNDRMI